MNPFRVYSAVIGTEDALRRPMTYDNHPSHPIQSQPIYSIEDEIS